MINLGHGVVLETSAELKEHQKFFDEEDSCKSKNFDEYPLWLTTDCGADPKGYFSVEECKADLGEDFEHLLWP